MPEAKWYPPDPPGRGPAIEGMAGIAAPLLAGFSITLIGVIAQASENFRWPGPALAVLVIAVALLIATVQFGFKARTFLYSAADVEAWRPDTFADERLRNVLAKNQRDDYGNWQRWGRNAGRAYDTAICFLALGLALTVAPPVLTSSGHPLGGEEATFRWIAFALALAAGTAELSWVVINRFGQRIKALFKSTEAHKEPAPSTVVPAISEQRGSNE
jgi:hypothetical protein